MLTKSPLILHLDLFAGHDVSVGVTITTPDDCLARLWEPGCGGGLSQFSFDENGTVPLAPATPIVTRWGVIDEARRRGLATSVMFGPLLPLLSDGPAEIESLLAAAAAHGVDTIWVDALNPARASGRRWPSCCGGTFPTCGSNTQNSLRPRGGAAYLAELQRRVDQTAEKLGISDCVRACVA